MIRPYQTNDLEAICEIHNQARVHELQNSVGLDPFLTFEQTYQNEGLFDGEVWVYEKDDDNIVVGFMAINEYVESGCMFSHNITNKTLEGYC